MLADFMTIKENFGYLEGINLTYVGDGRNNIAHSLMVAGAMLGVNVRICTPKSLNPKRHMLILQKKSESIWWFSHDYG